MADATFSDFALNPALQKAVLDAGYSIPTPIQAQTIPGILEGRDVMACAPTGTGKTAAFVLPALHKILSAPSPVTKAHGPRVLVLTPTRELAEQIVAAVRTFTTHARISSGLIIGGVSYQPQFKLLNNPLDLLVATPGRLIDHLRERKIDFRRIEMLVLDEADRMLDMGFLKPVETIISAVNDATGKKPQTLLFSATFEAMVEKVAQRVLDNPVRAQLAAARGDSHKSITHKAYMADNTPHKQTLLQKLLREKDVAQAIIFTATKRNADKLAEALHDSGFSAAALHGDMKQNARKRTLDGLHRGTLQVLVATDVAARGLDVKNLSHVFNYDLPNLPDDFTHRIGRTGRGGAVGIAISLVSPPDLPILRDIEKRLGKAFAFESYAGLEPVLSETDFRKLTPTEPPPGRPVQKGRKFGGGNGGGFSRSGPRPERSSGGERSENRSYGAKNGGGYSGGNGGGENRGGYSGGGGSRDGGGFGGKRDGFGGNGGKPAGGPRRDGGSRPQRRTYGRQD